MRYFVWLLRAFLFFVLFAFALNNLHTVSVNGFFGVHWNAPLVIVVLVAFSTGCALGVLAMVPAWWKQRRQSRQAQTPPSPGAASAPAAGPPAASTLPAPLAPDYAPEPVARGL
jgi:uncharacterized integral membrane protein